MAIGIKDKAGVVAVTSGETTKVSVGVDRRGGGGAIVFAAQSAPLAEVEDLAVAGSHVTDEIISVDRSGL